jgi:hypothetical protein
MVSPNVHASIQRNISPACIQLIGFLIILVSLTLVSLNCRDLVRRPLNLGEVDAFQHHLIQR